MAFWMAWLAAPVATLAGAKVLPGPTSTIVGL